MNVNSINDKGDESIDNNLRRLLLGVPAVLGTSLLTACGGGIGEVVDSASAGATSLPGEAIAAAATSTESGIQAALIIRRHKHLDSMENQTKFIPSHVSVLDWAKLNEFKAFYTNDFIDKYVTFKARLLAVYYIATLGGQVNGHIYVPELAQDRRVFNLAIYLRSNPSIIGVEFQRLQPFYQQHYLETLRNYHYNNSIPGAGALSYGPKYDIMKNFVISILNSETKINALKQHHPREFLRVRGFAKMALSHSEFLRLNTNIINAEAAHDRRLKVTVLGATENRIETKDMEFLYQTNPEVRFTQKARYFLSGNKRLPVENIDFEFRNSSVWLEESGLLSIKSLLSTVSNEGSVTVDPTELIEITNTSTTGDKYTKHVYKITPEVEASIRRLVDKEHSKNGDFIVIDNGVEVRVSQEDTKGIMMSIARQITETAGHVHPAVTAAAKFVGNFILFHVGVVRGMLLTEKFNIDTMRAVSANWETSTAIAAAAQSLSKREYIAFQLSLAILAAEIFANAISGMAQLKAATDAAREADKTGQSPSLKMLRQFTWDQYVLVTGQIVTTFSGFYGIAALSNVISNTDVTGEELTKLRGLVPAVFAFGDTVGGIMGIMAPITKVARREVCSQADVLQVTAGFIRIMGAMHFYYIKSSRSQHILSQAGMYGRTSLKINTFTALVAGILNMLTQSERINLNKMG